MYRLGKLISIIKNSLLPKNLAVYIILSLAISCKEYKNEMDCSRILSQKKKDSVELISFSKEFQNAVLTRDMNKISSFFQFPIKNRECIKKEKNETDSKEELISKTQFENTFYNDFFGEWFMETVTKGYIYYLLDCYPYNGNLQLAFVYPGTFVSKINNCEWHYFGLNKIDGRYKITSAWKSD